MICKQCGVTNPDNAQRCAACGCAFPPPLAYYTPPPPNPGGLGSDPRIRMLLPVGRSGWAIAAGYAGLFAFVIVPAPIALALGIVAIMDMKKHPDLHGMGRAVFGIVAGALGTIALIFMLVSLLIAKA